MSAHRRARAKVSFSIAFVVKIGEHSSMTSVKARRPRTSGKAKNLPCNYYNPNPLSTRPGVWWLAFGLLREVEFQVWGVFKDHLLRGRGICLLAQVELHLQASLVNVVDRMPERPAGCVSLTAGRRRWHRHT